MKSTSDKFPGFERLYSLQDPFWSQAYRGAMEVELEEAYALMRADLKLTNPIKVSYHMGGTPRDVIWTSYAGPLIVGARVLEVFGSFGGWHTYPVEVYDKEGRSIEGYAGLAVVGRCGPIDDSLSEVVLREFPGGTFPVRRGLLFQPDSWDGSPLFMPSERHNAVFVTDDVREKLELHKIENLAFGRLSEIERD